MKGDVYLMKRNKLSLFLIFCLCMSMFSTNVFASESWTVENFTPGPGMVINDMAEGNGVINAVGSNGKIAYSTDKGRTWIDSISGTNNYFFAITYAQNEFLAIGDDYKIGRSIDGINWDTITTTGLPNFSYTKRDLIYSKRLNLYVTVCDGGRIYTSTNLTAWTQRGIGLTSSSLGSIIDTGTKLIIFGYGVILESLDGISWTSASIAAGNDFRDSAYGADKIVAIGNNNSLTGIIFVSKDNGSSFQSISTGINEPLRKICYGDEYFIAVGQRGAIYFSKDNDVDTWTKIDVGSTKMFSALVYINGKFVTLSSSSGDLIILTPPASFPANSSEMTVTGDILPTIVSFTVPSSINYTINSNAATDEDMFIAPIWTITNDSNCPLLVEINSIVPAVDSPHIFFDVLPDFFSDKEWKTLNNRDSEQYLALGIKPIDDGSWRNLYSTNTVYAKYIENVADNVQIGALDPHTSVRMTLEAKHGDSFKQNLSSKNIAVLVFSLLG